MTKLIVTVGIPGSGKSKYCECLAKETGAELVSVSDVRYTKRRQNPNVTEQEVFSEVYELIRENLYNGNDCILDGSNLIGERREYLLRRIKKLVPNIPFRAICVIVATPIERCLFNNIKKGSPVKTEVIEDSYKNWETPGYWEGWDEIWCYYDNPDWRGIRGFADDFPADYINYDLNDKPEFDSLGGHCNSVHNHLLKAVHEIEWLDDERKNALLTASLIHDCGKPIVETHDDEKSLYYHHANAGAYEALFYDLGDADPVYVSGLICNHMNIYDWMANQQKMGAIVKRMGGMLIKDLILLNNADKVAKNG